jgi:hypothetical protein
MSDLSADARRQLRRGLALTAVEDGVTARYNKAVANMFMTIESDKPDLGQIEYNLSEAAKAAAMQTQLDGIRAKYEEAEHGKSNREKAKKSIASLMATLDDLFRKACKESDDKEECCDDEEAEEMDAAGKKDAEGSECCRDTDALDAFVANSMSGKIDIKDLGKTLLDEASGDDNGKPS